MTTALSDQDTQALCVLRAAREIISRKDRWTQNASARTASMEACTFEDPAARCWCLTGAIRRVAWALYGYDRAALLQQLIYHRIFVLKGLEVPKDGRPYFRYRESPEKIARRVTIRTNDDDGWEAALALADEAIADYEAGAEGDPGGP